MARREPTWVKIAHALLLHGARTRTGMTQKDFWPLVRGVNGKSPRKNTCSSVVDRMAANGAYFAKGPLRYGVGMGLVVGVSIGTESMRAALVDANGRVLPAPGNEDVSLEHGSDDAWHIAELAPAPDQTEMAPAALIERIADVSWNVVQRAFDDSRLLVDGRLPLLGVAVAWPTPLSRAEKIPTTGALQHPAWREMEAAGVHARVADRLGLETGRSHAINDANAIALAAAFDEIRAAADAGDGRFGRTLMALRIGGGLGAGTAVVGSPRAPAPRSAFLETRLVEGAGGFAGELGHLPVSEHDVADVVNPREPGLASMPRLACPCGRHGGPCLQTYASATAFVERMAMSAIGVNGLLEGDDRNMSSVMLEAMRNVRDGRQVRAQRDIGQLIGRSLAAPVLTLNPSSITLAGSLAVAHVKAGIDAERERWRHPYDDDVEVRILQGRTNRFSSARGAAIAALRGRLYRRFDELDSVEMPLATLTTKLDKQFVKSWRGEHAVQLRAF